MLADKSDNYIHYTKTPKTKYEKRFAHIHYQVLVGILKNIQDFGGHVTWAEVSKLTGVSRYTIGKHFPTAPRNELRIAIWQMFEDFDVCLLERKDDSIRSNSVQNEIYIQTLFRMMNKASEFFYIICDDKRHEGVIYCMAETLCRHLRFDWQPEGTPEPDFDSDQFRMCIRMLQEVIMRWALKTHCDVKDSEAYVARMLRIVKAAEDGKML